MGKSDLGRLSRPMSPLPAAILREACITDFENQINVNFPQIRNTRKFSVRVPRMTWKTTKNTATNSSGSKIHQMYPRK